MVMVLQQDIPSDQLIHYRRSLIPAVDPALRQYATRQFASERYGPPESLLYANKYGDNYYHGRPYGAELYPHLARATSTDQMSFVRKRMQHFWPRMRNDSPFSPSAAQRKVRAAFKKCVDCFNIQPYEGGVEPPDIGPRNRSWWYAQAGEVEMWYYNWFIMQSWWTFFKGQLPAWCSQTLSGTWGAIWAKSLMVNYLPSCNAAWAAAVQSYHAQSPFETTSANFSDCGGTIWAFAYPNTYYRAAIANSFRYITFDLSDNNIYNSFGIHIEDVQQIGFLISLTVVQIPKNKIETFDKEHRISCPSQSGDYIFGNLSQYLGQNPVTFRVGGQDWDIAPGQPPCPPPTGGEEKAGYTISNCKIYVI